jgi:iron complex outermembrane receptor protein
MPKFGVNTHSCALRRLALGASSLAFGVALAASPALAQQTAANAPSNGIETVTVTAQYVTQNVQATPLAISVVTAQDLDQRGIGNLAQLGTTVPALTLTPAPAAFGNGLQTYVRGIGQYDTAFASEPGVGIYVDDIYYGTMSASELNLLDLNRIEVLKGPQGVLGGKNDLGGAIKLFTQKPSDDNSGYVQATYGSFNDIDVKGAANLTVIPGHLYLRVSAYEKKQDGFLNVIDYACAFGPGTNASGPGSAGSLPAVTQHKDCKLGTQGGTDVSAARLAVRYVFDSHLEDNFAIDVVRDNSELAPDVLYAVDPGCLKVGPGCPVVDPTGNSGNVYFNNGHGLQSVPRAQFLNPAGITTPGAVPATSIPGWNAAYNIPRYGIPYDQRFIPNNPFKTTYATYSSQEGNLYTDGEKVHSWDLSNVLDYDVFNWFHFKSITGYRYYNSAYSNDSDVSPMSFELTTTYPTNREFQQEIRFTGSLFDDKLEWTTGGFFYYRENRSFGPVQLDANFDTGASFLEFEQNDTYKTQNKSGYLHLIYHLFDNVELFAGARYTSESKTYYFDHSGSVPGYPFSGFFRATVDPLLDCNIFVGHLCDHSINPALVPHTSTTERPDWRAGVDYHVTDDAMVYFQFSTGYRTGGTNSRPFAPDQLNSFGPEELKSYEIGAKTQWFDNRLRVNVAAYTADYTHTIVPLALTDFSLGFPLPEVLYVNLGSSQDKGFELEATAVPIDNLLITANYAYTDETANPVPGSPAGFLNPQATAVAGSSPILFPARTANFSIQYAFKPDMEGWGTFTPRLEYDWQDKIFQDGNNNPFTEIPARGLLNGSIAWDAPQGDWQVMFLVTNLTDKKYFLDTFDLAIFGSGTVEAQPGRPREWFVTIKKKF